MKAYISDGKVFVFDDKMIWITEHDDQFKIKVKEDYRKTSEEKTGNKFRLTNPEGLTFNREAILKLKPLKNIPKSDYARFMAAMNSDIAEEERLGPFIVKDIGNWSYITINKEYGDYPILRRVKIDKDVDDTVKMRKKKRRRKHWHFPQKKLTKR